MSVRGKGNGTGTRIGAFPHLPQLQEFQSGAGMSHGVDNNSDEFVDDQRRFFTGTADDQIRGTLAEHCAGALVNVLPFTSTYGLSQIPLGYVASGRLLGAEKGFVYISSPDRSPIEVALNTQHWNISVEQRSGNEDKEPWLDPFKMLRKKAAFAFLAPTASISIPRDRDLPRSLGKGVESLFPYDPAVALFGTFGSYEQGVLEFQGTPLTATEVPWVLKEGHLRGNTDRRAALYLLNPNNVTSIRRYIP